jgi:hypothetical protein
MHECSPLPKLHPDWVGRRQAPHTGAVGYVDHAVGYVDHAAGYVDHAAVHAVGYTVLCLRSLLQIGERERRVGRGAVRGSPTRVDLVAADAPAAVCRAKESRALVGTGRSGQAAQR